MSGWKSSAGAGRPARRVASRLLGWRGAGFALFAVMTCAAWVGCARRESGAAHSGHVLRISQRNEPASLDPALAPLPDDLFVIRAVGEGLLVPGADGSDPHPGAAERFEVSPDGLIYTFHLRPNGRWSNGEPVTAANFVESYQRALKPSTGAPKADLFFGVRNARAFASGALGNFSMVGFRAADDHTLVVTLARPDPRFPLYAASGPWIPVNPRVVAQHGRKWTEPAHHVGNGPFVLVEWRSQQRIVVRKNPSYHSPAAVKLDEIQFIRTDDENVEERAYRSGQIDVTMAVPPTKLDSYARERAAELHRTPLAETRYLSFNLTRRPLADPRVRRALSLALDRQKIVARVLSGGQAPAERFIPPPLRKAMPAAGDSAGEPTPPPNAGAAADAARALLAAAGYAGGKDFPKLELSAWSPSQTPVLEAIQAMWHESLGINVAIVIHEAKVHLAALRAGSYDIAFATTLLDVADPLSLLSAFKSNAPDNFPHWIDPAFDRAMDLAQTRGNLAAQGQDLLAAERTLLEAAPVAPIYFNVRNYLVSPRVHGWQEDALWTRFYLNLSRDEK